MRASGNYSVCRRESSEHQFVRARVTGPAFGQMSGSQQSMLAEALVAAANERRKLDNSVVTLCPKRSESIHSSLADVTSVVDSEEPSMVATDEAATLLTIAR